MTERELMKLSELYKYNDCDTNWWDNYSFKIQHKCSSSCEETDFPDFCDLMMDEFVDCLIERR